MTALFIALRSWSLHFSIINSAAPGRADLASAAPVALTQLVLEKEH
jgi:hypothetical protein